jgi:hypothetical protein
VNNDGSTCRLTWAGLQSEAGRFDIDVTQTIRLAGDDVTFTMEVTNRSPYIIST